MCGIAGFSISDRDRINARSLGHHLLAAIESRGAHASGYAFSHGGKVGLHKDALPGSQLPMTAMPRRAKTAIFHTRYATQGKPEINENNHPVVSPGGTIALTHNGVISNDWKFRKSRWESKYQSPSKTGDDFDVAQVDSAVIPALLEKYGVDSFADLEGYAAVAWLDDTDQAPTVHLARLLYSPVYYTWTPGGSFIYASTEKLLTEALAAAGIPFGAVFEMQEGEYFQVTNGWVMASGEVEMEADWRARRKFASATAGGHGSTTYGTTRPATTPAKAVATTSKPVGTVGTVGSEATVTTDPAVAGKGSEDTGSKPYVPSTFGAVQFSDGSDAIDDGMPAGTPSTWTDEEWAEIEAEIDEALKNEGDALDGIMECSMDDKPESNDGDLQGFYFTLEDGTIEIVTSIDELEKRLEWYAGMGLWDNPPFPNAEPRLKWTNFITDMGHLSKRDDQVSWLDNLAEIDQHESPSVYNLDYVRDGLALMLAGMDAPADATGAA